MLKEILECNKARCISVSSALEKWRQEDQGQPELRSVTSLQKNLVNGLLIYYSYSYIHVVSLGKF